MEIASTTTIHAPRGETRRRTLIYERRRLLNALALSAGDGLALILSILAAGSVRYFWMGLPLIPVWIWYLIPIWWCASALAGLLPSWGLGPVEELRRLTMLLLVGFASTAVLLFLSKQAHDVSRLTLTSALCFSLLAVPLFRLHVKRLLIRFDCWGVPTAIYGSGVTGQRIVRLLQQEMGLGYQPVSMFDDAPGCGATRIGGVPVKGRLERVNQDAPVAVLAVPDIGIERSTRLLEGLLSSYRTVLLVNDLMEAPSLWVRPRDLNGMLGLEIRCNLASPLAGFGKRATDVLFTLLLAPVWVPLCLLLALLIWLQDRASPLFLQQRIGHDGRIFETWKLRTMVCNAEEALREKLEEDEALRREWEACYKLKKDPRITHVGRFIRRCSLDELPQLINVLRGEMSLVGPRPLPRYHHEELPERVRVLRERVRPGLTGLWQVSGRSDIGTEGIEQLDPYYVRNWSLWLDIVVLIRTARVVVHGSGAY